MLSFTTGSNLSCYQLKRHHFRHVIVCKPHSNHKAKISCKFTKNKEKKNISIPLKNSSNHKGKDQEKQGTKKNHKNIQRAIKKMVTGTNLSTITLNVSGLNSQVKKQHELINNTHDSSTYCLQDTPFRCEDICKL